MSPDIDIVFTYLGPEATLLYRRAITHSIFFAPILAAVLWILGKSLFEHLKARDSYAIILGLCGLHLVFDLVNSYGTQILYPLSDHRFAWDLVFIVDPFWMMSLLTASVLGGLPGQPRRWIGKIGLSVCLLYPLLCFGAREWMQSKIEAQDGAVEKVSLLPDAFSPWYWKIIQERETQYQVWGQSFGGAQTPPKSFEKLSIETQAEWQRVIPFFKTYFWFNRFPALAEQASPPSVEQNLRVLDLRFVSIHPWLAESRGGDEPPFFVDILIHESIPMKAVFSGVSYLRAQ
jgi:inner membrane protein